MKRRRASEDEDEAWAETIPEALGCITQLTETPRKRSSRKREIKTTIGFDLNPQHYAQTTLHQVWPHHKPIPEGWRDDGPAPKHHGRHSRMIVKL